MKMKRIVTVISVVLLRLMLAVWVGGAALFVITSVAEQTNPEFDSVTRDQLATVRFPLYYLFGAITLTMALVGGAIASFVASGCLRKRMRVAMLLTVLSAGLAVVDYVWIYQPLQKLIIPPGQARTQEFITLHERSRHINEVHVTLALVASVLAAIPPSDASSRSCGSGIPI